MALEIISWNIQTAKGVDGLTSTQRIADDIREFSDADVICLQEVLRTDDNNQVAELSHHFPDHQMYFGAAINRADQSGRLEFGNLILSRLKVLQVVNHKLPEPAEPEVRYMPRQAIEVILEFRNEPLRLVTTHLEFFASGQRTKQVEYLADQLRESELRFRNPSPAGGNAQFMSIPETALSIYTGDFNFAVDSEDYNTLTQGLDVAFLDAWRLVHKDKPHDPTCGIFDHVQWTEGPHCRDFFFVSPDMASRVIGISVQTQTAASDHQPLKLIVN